MTRRITSQRAMFCGILLGMFLMTAAPVPAATLTWVGGSGTWNTTSTVWNGSSVAWPTAGTDVALFNGTAGTVTISGSVGANGLTFDVAGYTLTGGTLAFTPSTPKVTANQSATIASTVVGSEGFQKDGAGTLTLSAINTYSGVTTFTAGTVNVGSLSSYGQNGSLGNRAVGGDGAGNVGLLFRGGALQYTGSTAQTTNRAIRVGLEGATLDASGSLQEATMSFTASTSPDFFYFGGARTLTLTGTNAGNNTFAMTIAEAGGVTSVAKSGQGTWVLSGSSTYSGGTTINDGLLRLGNARALGATSGTLSINGGRLDLNGNSITAGVVSITAAGSSGDTIQSGTLTGSSFTASNPSGNAVISAVLASSGGVSKSGAGTLTLSAANTYSGVTTFTGGTVNVGSLSNYGSNGSLGNRAAGDEVAGGTLGLLFRGGALQYTGSTAQTTNRAIRVGLEGATLDASGSLPEATMSFTATSSPSFFFDGGNRAITFTGSNTGNNTFAMAIGEVSGVTNVIKSGQGKWVLTGTSSYKGITTFSVGVLEVSALTNYGVNGPLGARLDWQEGASSIGLLFKGGTLRYSGSTSQSTNRAIRVGTEGATLDASGSLPEATMSFSAASSPGFLDGSGARQVTFTGSNAGNNTFAMAIGESGGATSVVKSGQGTWVLSGSSTYSGGTAINDGLLRLGNARALGATTGTLTVNGGRLDLNGNSITAGVVSITAAASTGATIQSGTLTGSSFTVSNPSGNAVISTVLASSGGVDKSGAGTLTLSAANTYSGVTTFTSGTVNVGSLSNYGANGSLGNRAVGGDGVMNIGLLFRGGALQYTGSTAQSTNRAIRVGLEGATLDASGSLPEATMSFTATSSPDFFFGGGNRTVTFNGSNAGNNTFAMAIGQASGSTDVIKSGQGKWVLTGASSYTGTTTFSGGVLEVSALTNYGVNGPLGGRLSSQEGGTSIGLLFKGGTLRYSGSTSQSTNRAIRVGTEGATLDASGSLPDATMNFTAASSPGFLDGSGARQVTFTGSNAGNNTFAMAISESGGVTSVVKSGQGTWVLSGSSTYTGGTLINVGTLRAGNSMAFGSGSITLASGATLDINNLAVANTITSNGGTILNAASLTGTTTLSSGTTVLQNIGGTVQIAASAVADLSGTINADVTVNTGGRGRALGEVKRNVTVSGGASFDILNDATIDEAASFSFVNNGQILIERETALTLSKVISGTGSLRKSGNGRVTLTGNNSFSGATLVEAGALIVNGTLAGNVVVSDGAMLGGVGVLGKNLSGAGTVSVGNSPGIGDAGSVDPSLGTDWVFEITGTAPTWNAGPSPSANDVLRLTDATPFLAGLTASNVVDVLFDLGGTPVAKGSYLGGFFVDEETFDLAAALQNGQFRYWVAGEHGDVGQRQQFNVGTEGAPVWYSLLSAYDSSLSASYTTTQQTVNFGSGAVTGNVTQFVVVPEPGTLVFAGIGVGMWGWSLWKRRRINRTPHK